jgi:hypothetical protein
MSGPEGSSKSRRKRARAVVRTQDFVSLGGSAKCAEITNLLAAVLHAQIANLAVSLDPSGMKSSDPGPVLRQAAALIERVPEYLHVGFEKLSSEEMKRFLLIQIQSRDAEDADWDRDIPPHFTFFEAVNKNWCRFKTVKGLYRFMKQQGYPGRYFPSINIAAYQIAEKRERAAKQDSERLRKQKARSQKEKKTKFPADKKSKHSDKNA